MRSLWSGVSGLKTHQIGMDVEGNNIANVNTYGFKYSRVNYGTMFSQVMGVATSPTGNLGGQNAMQVGLGVGADATTRIHSQGSISKTGWNYDMALSGNGFFMVSGDGGRNKYLTRDGSFTPDAEGNFVNANGMIVQGWNRDSETGQVDTTLPVQNIKWDPKMKLPANPSSQILLSASLNSGARITENTSRRAYGLDSVHGYNVTTTTANDENDTGNTQFYTTSKNALDITEKGVDMASVFKKSGTDGISINLREGQGMWISYADATFTTNKGGTAVFNPNNNANQNNVIFWGDENNAVNLNITLNGISIQNNNIRSLQEAVNFINTYTQPTDTRDGTGVIAVAKSDGSGITFTNTNASGTTDNMKNINLTINTGNSAGETANLTWNANTQTYTATLTPIQGNVTSNWAETNPNINLTNNIQVVTAHKYTYTSSAVDLDPMFNPDGGPAYTGPNAGTTAQNITQRNQWPNTDQGLASYNYYMATVQGSIKNDTSARVFRTTEDLRELIQRDARYGVDYDGSANWNGTNDVNGAVKITMNTNGQYVVSNANEPTALPDPNAANPGTINPGANLSAAKNMNFEATSYVNRVGLVSANDALASFFQGWDGPLNVGTQNKIAAEMLLSSFGTSLEIFDSLGTSHLIKVQWTKQTTTVDGGNEWQMILRVDEPATINSSGVGPSNIVVGTVRFGNDGSLVSYTPRTINFSGNNGSSPNQQITLNLGASGEFSGLVSNDVTSAMDEQKTDGYKPGTLQKGAEAVRIDQYGNIIGTFDNGQTQVLATVAVGSVTNDSGLEEIGGNLLRITGNSGDLTVGLGGTGGRGNIKSASLEMSNADLSTSLTNLIIIQRGYQANSKTITTSDQLLNTLLQLKQ